MQYFKRLTVKKLTKKYSVITINFYSNSGKLIFSQNLPYLYGAKFIELTESI